MNNSILQQINIIYFFILSINLENILFFMKYLIFLRQYLHVIYVFNSISFFNFYLHIYFQYDEFVKLYSYIYTLHNF